MKHLNQLDFAKVSGGKCVEIDSEYESFKKELKELSKSAANNIGDGVDSLSHKINDLLEKYK